MKSALVVGGSNGIGLSIALHLEGYDRVYIIDKQEPACPVPANVRYLPFDLLDKDYTLFDRLDESISTLVITAGYGRLALFSDVEEYEIERLFMVNTIGVIRILKHFYSKLHSATDDFHCAVMVSIAGIVASPFFSIYGASKAALHRFIESVNVELEKAGAKNRVLEVSPGSIKGTNFSGGGTDLTQTEELALRIIERMMRKELLYIPQYEEIFRSVIARYREDAHAFGLESYEYKLKSGRIGSK